LKRTNSEAAPTSCFCQHPIPPSNDFKVGQKIETVDPRNTSSTCIGTIIEKNGSRLRLRLDGTDDRNDFWLPVDSDLIHPYEYSAKLGRSIQPPLGFGFELSRWPKFLEKIISNANENQFASEDSFKKAPQRPARNEFKIGQKLEAVDPKNPHLICPATVVDTKRDKILISFDGWQKSSQFWCSYSSRDIFPVGWCKLAGHTLQFPGDLEEKQTIQAATTHQTATATATIKRRSSLKSRNTITQQLKRNNSSVKGGRLAKTRRHSKIKEKSSDDEEDDADVINYKEEEEDEEEKEEENEISADSSIKSSFDITVPDFTTATSSPLIATPSQLNKKGDTPTINNNKVNKTDKKQDVKKLKMMAPTPPINNPITSESILDLSIVKNEKIDFDQENEEIESNNDNNTNIYSNLNNYQNEIDENKSQNNNGKTIKNQENVNSNSKYL
jgi:hypothetical protein